LKVERHHIVAVAIGAADALEAAVEAQAQQEQQGWCETAPEPAAAMGANCAVVAMVMGSG